MGSANAWLDSALDSRTQTRLLMRSGVAVHHTTLDRFINFAECCIEAGVQRGFGLIAWGLAVSTACSETSLHEGTQR